MAEIVVSSSSDREIDEYHDDNNSSGGCSGNSKSGSTDEVYLSGTPGIPLEVFQEEMRKMAASGSSAGPSITPPLSIASPPRQTEDVLVCCAMNIPLKIDDKRLLKLRDKYQIPNEVHTHLPTLGEWCCTLNSPRVGIYEAYLLGGLRLPLNAFARELLRGLGIGLNQLNLDSWRIIVSMQVLWREVFDGNRPITVD